MTLDNANLKKVIDDSAKQKMLEALSRLVAVYEQNGITEIADFLKSIKTAFDENPTQEVYNAVYEILESLEKFELITASSLAGVALQLQELADKASLAFMKGTTELVKYLDELQVLAETAQKVAQEKQNIETNK